KARPQDATRVQRQLALQLIIVSSLLLAGLNNGTPWIMVSIMTVFTLLSFLSTLGGGKAQPKMAEI
ncbi:hypothetical protein, partial [Pantoea sp. ME81]|uniref:hypothetical protein n=1 Tax=Pantoea sp. ME81 TaxID=2743935 RepID=UPI0015F3833D